MPNAISIAGTKISATGWGLIAGNGRFPFLVLEGARQQGIDMTVIAIKEEAAPELANSAKRIHWVSLGELSKTIDLLHQEGVTQAVMAGQVKHNKIFSSIRPDWKLTKLLFSLTSKNTDALIGGVAKILEDEHIHLVDSTLFLQPLIPAAGVLTRRAPDVQEAADIDYGLGIARKISAMDIGQTIVVSDQACVAVEAMEGTDETIARASRLAAGKPLVVEAMEGTDETIARAARLTAGRGKETPLVVIKVSKPGQDMRFDVPVIGLPTVEQMQSSGATALAIDAGRTLLFDREKLLELADAAGIAIQAFPPGTAAEPSAAPVGTTKSAGTSKK
jgi:UDP-2,3-diacylglucosamine hydrolase